MALNTNSRLSSEDSNKLRAQVKSCADIIKFHPYGHKYKQSYQSARAPPNERLVQTFGIDNAFTTLDSERKGVFNRETIEKMKAAIKLDRTSKEDWSDVCVLAQVSVKEYLARKGRRVDLTELVQYCTLNSSLCYLFEDARAALEQGDHFDTVISIGHRINELWIESKATDGQSRDWTQERKLHDALRRVTAPRTPGTYPSNSTPEPGDPTQNPMNLLLPAYETMWRVVLRCLLEVRFRGAGNGPQWSQVLEDYVNNLDKASNLFQKALIDDIRPIDVVKEALRLYPPTRRVHRVFDGELHKADIEACHRSTLLGGDDPLVFRPERWQNICLAERQMRYNGITGHVNLKEAEQDLGFMPFGYWCTADTSETKGFGMKMIALLVGAICIGLGKDWQIEGVACGLPTNGEPLSSERTAYQTLPLARSD